MASLKEKVAIIKRYPFVEIRQPGRSSNDASFITGSEFLIDGGQSVK